MLDDGIRLFIQCFSGVIEEVNAGATTHDGHRPIRLVRVKFMQVERKS